MTRMIQIRNVPEEIHRVLKVKAAREGMSLSDFLLREVTQVARKPSLDELVAKLDREGPSVPDFDSIAAVREVRGR